MKALARNLRKNQTDAEKILWLHLKLNRLEGIKFRRQQPIGDYIVDFVSFEKKIVIEVDGGQHSSEKDIKTDTERTNWLNEQGFKVLRFWNNEVLQNIEGVLETIWEMCHPHLTSPIKGEE